MATLAGRAYIEVAYDPGSVSKLRAVTAAEGQRMASSWSKTASSFKSVGASLTKYVTLPIGLAGAASIKVAADFDSSMSKIQGLVGASADQMEFYRKSILSLAPAVAQGPEALADALYFVTSSGFKGAEALDILTVSAKASTAGLGETQQIADLVTSAMTAYGSKVLSAAQATDILVAATKAGKGDPAEFAQALQLNVAAAENLGISFDQLAAATAALSTVNSNVSEDATQLSGIFTALIKPSKEGAEVLEKVGLSAAKLRAEVADKGLLPALLDLKDRVHGNVTELQALFPNVRGLRGTFTLIGKAAQRNVSIFDQVAHSTGNLNKAFATALTNDPQVQFKKMTAQLQVLAIVIGETLIPIALKLASVFVNLATKFKGLSETQQNILLIGAAFLFVVGPVLSLIGNVTKFGEALFTVAKALRIVTAATWLWDAALAANPIGLIIIGLAALAVAFVIAYKKSATFRAVVHGALHAAAAAVDFVRAHWQAFLPLIAILGRLIVAAASHFSSFKSTAVSAFNAVRHAIQPTISAIQTLISYVLSLISQIASIHWPSPPSWLTSHANLLQGLLPHTGGIVTPRGMQGYAAGGMVLGGIAGRDSVPALLTPGELVLNEKQQRALLHGGMSGGDIIISIDGRILDERVDYRVSRSNQSTARTVKAGRRSTA